MESVPSPNQEEHNQPTNQLLFSRPRLQLWHTICGSSQALMCVVFARDVTVLPGDCKLFFPRRGARSCAKPALYVLYCILGLRAPGQKVFCVSCQSPCPSLAKLLKYAQLSEEPPMLVLSLDLGTKKRFRHSSLQRFQMLIGNPALRSGTVIYVRKTTEHTHTSQQHPFEWENR